MSAAFPFFGPNPGFWPPDGPTVFDAICLGVVFSILFPLTFNAAVVTAPISQLFFKSVSKNRSARIRLALCANAIGSLASFVTVLMTLFVLSVTANAGLDVAPLALFMVLFVCPFLVPGACEGWLWSRWAGRPMMARAMCAQATGRVLFAALILASRIARDFLFEKWINRYRVEALTFLHGVGFFCLAVLILAWFRRPELIESHATKPEGTVA